MNSSHPIETLQEIRSLMERSSRFISLSGLSGVMAGVVALLGAAAIYVYLGTMPFNTQRLYYSMMEDAGQRWGIDYYPFLILDAFVVLVLALGFGIFFTTRNARRKGQKIWDSLTRRLLVNLMIPLATGGLFCLALLYHNVFGLVAPATLVFYGLALVNASKYTLPDVRLLGISEIALGILAAFFVGFGLEFWAIGFGILHIVYGAAMYFKYEGKQAKA